jgi:hypothetical protein
VSLLKTRAALGNLVLAPHVQSALGPVCMTCGRVVDEESLVEGYPGETTFAKVLVKHHGAEELRTFEMGSTNWDEQDLASYMRRTNWFDPTAHEGLGMGARVINPDEAQPGDQDVKPMIVVP